MKLWRLTRAEHAELDGLGGLATGGRYYSPGHRIVSFASEAGLAVLVALRYRTHDPAPDHADYVLGWTEVAEIPERLPPGLEEPAIRPFVDDWAKTGRSLLLAVPSAVLPEADVVMMNALHQDAGGVAPLVTRRFRFEDCLHRPPMLDAYRS